MLPLKNRDGQAGQREAPRAQPQGTEIYSLTPDCSVHPHELIHTPLNCLTHTHWLQLHLQTVISELRMTDTYARRCMLSYKWNVFICLDPVSVFVRSRGHWNMRIFLGALTCMWTCLTQVRSHCTFWSSFPRLENWFLVIGFQLILYFICFLYQLNRIIVLSVPLWRVRPALSPLHKDECFS